MGRFVALEGKIRHEEKAHAKRIKELEDQRMRLEKDLQSKVENVRLAASSLSSLNPHSLGSLFLPADDSTPDEVRFPRPHGSPATERRGCRERAVLPSPSSPCDALSVLTPTALSVSRLSRKSLQQRLEQLVAVHRQLLRKFASLELENSELKKKTQLRDEVNTLAA